MLPLTLKSAKIVEKVVEDIYAFHFDYSIMSEVMNAIKKQKLEMVHQDFGNSGLVHIAIRPVSYTHLTLPTICSV